MPICERNCRRPGNNRLADGALRRSGTAREGLRRPLLWRRIVRDPFAANSTPKQRIAGVIVTWQPYTRKRKSAPRSIGRGAPFCRAEGRGAQLLRVKTLQGRRIAEAGAADTIRLFILLHPKNRPVPGQAVPRPPGFCHAPSGAASGGGNRRRQNGRRSAGPHPYPAACG